MPKYLCLRDCYVHDRFHYMGRVYDLNGEQSPKNFELMSAVTRKKAEDEAVAEAQIESQVEGQPENDSDGDNESGEDKAPDSPETFVCEICGKESPNATVHGRHKKTHKKE